MSVTFALERPVSLRRWLLIPAEAVKPTVMIIDFLAIICASVGADALYGLAQFHAVPELRPALLQGMVVGTFFVGAMELRRNYGINTLSDYRQQVRCALGVWIYLFALFLVVGFLLKLTQNFSRGMALIFFVFGAASLLIWRASLVRSLSRAPFARRASLVLGERARLTPFGALGELARFGYRPLRIFEVNTAGARPLDDADFEELAALSRARSIDDIFLFMGWDNRKTIADCAERLSELPSRVHLVTDPEIVALSGARSTRIGNVTLCEIVPAPLTRLERYLKRLFDLALGCLALMAVAPLMIFAAVAVKMDSAGPVFFKQDRGGARGRSFKIIKFRTMHVMENEVIQQATRDDARTSRVGRWLRRTSIDELPQLFNIIKGDMSFVGPRPHALSHDLYYSRFVPNYQHRSKVKPGLTGWAQINGRRGGTPNVESMVSRVEHDLWYIRNWSFWLDMTILARTIPALLRPEAY